MAPHVATALLAGLIAGVVAGLFTAVWLRPYIRDLDALDARLHECETRLGLGEDEPDSETLSIDEWYAQRDREDML